MTNKKNEIVSDLLHTLTVNTLQEKAAKQEMEKAANDQSPTAADTALRNMLMSDEEKRQAREDAAYLAFLDEQDRRLAESRSLLDKIKADPELVKRHDERALKIREARKNTDIDL